MSDDEKTGEEVVKTLEAKESDAEKAERKDDDSIKWRSKYKVAKEELETIRAKSDNEKQELASKVESTAKERQVYEQKYIEAEVKAHAVAAGIRDIEFVKLIDKGEIKLDEKGNLVGVEKAISDLKTRKPDWFGEEKKTSSSKNAEFPNKETNLPKNARDISKEDWRKNKAQFMAGKLKI